MTERMADVGRGITLCYETFGDEDDEPLLLVMGLAVQMHGWHEDFCTQLADRGFHVIRFDNRDVGRSTWSDAPVPSIRQIVSRRFSSRQYSLDDMADDADGLLGHLGARPAHVVGVSMGGMIGQVLSARHPESVRSLVSIMSTTGSRIAGQPRPRALRFLLSATPREREAFVEYAERAFGAFASPGFPKDDDWVRERAERSFDRGHNPAGGARQLAAVLRSGNRTRTLRSIGVPTLVIHGTDDPLIHRSGGRATARAIRGSELMMIRGMAHDLPRGAWDQIIDGIVATAERSRTEAAAA